MTMAARWCWPLTMRTFLKVGHQQNTFKSSDPDRPGSYFFFPLFLRPVLVPCHTYTYLYFSRQDGPLSFVIVKIVIPCCLHPSGDLLCKANTWHTPKCFLLSLFRMVKSSFDFLFLLNFIPLPPTWLTTGRSLIRSIFFSVAIANSFVFFEVLWGHFGRDHRCTERETKEEKVLILLVRKPRHPPVCRRLVALQPLRKLN